MPASSTSKSEQRESNSVSATRDCIRAAAAPRQWWAPWLNVRMLRGQRVNVELACVRAVLALVAVARAVDQQHPAAGRDGGVADGHVAGDSAGQRLRRRGES